jgi:hypothetical protein
LQEAKQEHPTFARLFVHGSGDSYAPLRHPLIRGPLLIIFFALLALALVWFFYGSADTFYFIVYCLLITVILFASMYAAGLADGFILFLVITVMVSLEVFVIPEYIVFYKGDDVVNNIAVNDAVKYPDARGFRFSGGRLLLDKTGDDHEEVDVSNDGGPTGSITYYIVPFVEDDWKEGDSVYVWAADLESTSYLSKVPFHLSEAYPKLQNRWNAGISLKTKGQEYHQYDDALRDAVDRHGIKTRNKPVLLYWCSSPEKYASGYIKLSLKTFAGIIFGWIVLTLAHRAWYAGYRSKKKSAK